MEGSRGPPSGPHLQPQQPPTVEDMYKVISRIVLAHGPPSGLSLEIWGGGSSDRRWEVGVEEMGSALHPGDDEGMAKSHPGAQAPASCWVEGLGGKFSARYLEGYCFLGIFTF